MAIAVSYFPVYEWTTTFLLCWLSLSSTTVETWTVWTVEQLLIEPLLVSSLKTVSTTACCALAPRLEDKWKLAIDDWLTTKLWQLAQDQTDPAVHQSFKITILLGPPCSSKQWCKVIWSSWNKMLEIAETFSMSLSMAGRHPKSQSKVRPVQKTLIYVQRAALWLTHRKYQLESWMLTSKEEQTSAFWGSMSKGFEARKEIVWEWSSRTSTRWTRQAKWALVKFLK